MRPYELTPIKKFVAGFMSAALLTLLVPGAISQGLGQVANGKVTTSNPTYVNGSANGLSLDTNGNLRVTTSGGTTPSKVIMDCIAQTTTLPAATDTLPFDCVSYNRGEIFTIPRTFATTGADGSANTSGAQIGVANPTANQSGQLVVRGMVFNGSTWDRVRGDTNGAWVQGNVASGATDAGSPVKIGGVFNTTPPTLTNGQRGDVQLNANGGVWTQAQQNLYTGVDGVSNAALGTALNSNRTVNLLSVMAPHRFNGSTWDRDFTCTQSAVINVTAGSTTQLVALSGSTVIRVCSYMVDASASGTFQFVYGTGANCGTGTTNITGAMTIAANGNNGLSSGNGSLFRTAAGNALCLAAVTGNMTGFVSYAQF